MASTVPSFGIEMLADGSWLVTDVRGQLHKAASLNDAFALTGAIGERKETCGYCGTEFNAAVYKQTVNGKVACDSCAATLIPKTAAMRVNGQWY
jgi:hypothetical protein